MMPLWAIAIAYLLARHVPSLSWWEIPVYGVVLAGMAGYFVSFPGTLLMSISAHSLWPSERHCRV